jgi:hypothetical protein
LSTNVRASGNAPDPDTKAIARAGPASPDERHLIRTTRLNLLLIGMGHDTGELLSELRSALLEPISTWSPGERLVLPTHAQTGTFIINDISALGLDDQCRLNDWLGATDGRTRVVSLTSKSVVPLIETGAFLSTLYYRLNVVCVDMTESVEQAQSTG